jgi:hypothetical protein
LEQGALARAILANDSDDGKIECHPDSMPASDTSNLNPFMALRPAVPGFPFSIKAAHFVA